LRNLRKSLYLHSLTAFCKFSHGALAAIIDKAFLYAIPATRILFYALGRAYKMQTVENPILSLTKHSKLHLLAALMLSHALARCTFNGATQSLSLSKNMLTVCRWRDQPVISHCTRDKADLALEDEVYRTTLEIERSQDGKSHQALAKTKCTHCCRHMG